MLWNAHYEIYPEFDRLLDNHANKVEGCSLERLFTENGFLQELQQSERLQRFLAKRPQLEKLITYAFAEIGQEHEKNDKSDFEASEESNQGGIVTKARAAYLSMEVLVSNSWVITQAIISDPEMLKLILKAPLSKPRPLECKVAERLDKVVGHLLSRGSVELGAYVREEWEQIQHFLIPSLSDAYMSGLMLKLWVVSSPHPESTSQRFAEDLIAQLSPASSSELAREAVCHTLVDIATLPLAADSTQHPAIHVISTLMNPCITNKLVDYLMDSAQSQASACEILSLIITLLQWPLKYGIQDCAIAYKEFILTLVHRANEIHSVANIANLATIKMSTGSFVPLGPLRFKVSEFWTQLLRAASNQQNEDLSADFSMLELDSTDNISDAVCRTFLRHDVLGWLLGLLLEFPWHNMFHNVVYELIHHMLTWPHPPPSARRLLLDLFTCHELVARLIEGHRKGSHAVGYLGHFVLIGDDIMRFVAKMKPGDEIHDGILESMEKQGWQTYLQEYLLPAQRKSKGGDTDDSVFGEWCLKHITAQNNYLDEDEDEDEDPDEIDPLRQYSLEDNIEIDIDLHYEEDEDDKGICLLPNGTSIQHAWMRASQDGCDDFPGCDGFVNGWSFEKYDSILTHQAYVDFNEKSGGLAFEGEPIQHTGDESFLVDLADDDEGLGVKLDIVKIPPPLNFGSAE